MQNDHLHQIFDRYIKDLSRPHQCMDELIFDVVAEYILHLMNIGNVPHHLLDIIEVEIKEEVVEIYRKKTYGYLSLEDYRSNRIRKSC